MSSTRISASRLSAVGADEVLDEVVGGRHQQLGRGRVLGQHTALLHDRDPVAHLDRLVDVVGDEEDGLADVRLQAQELVLQALAADRVDGAEGLVHQHQRRVGGERLGDADALLLATGELRRIAVLHVGRQPDQLQQLVYSGLHALGLPANEGGHGGDVVADGPMREQPGLLNHVADLADAPARAP